MGSVLVKAATGPVVCGHGGTVKVQSASKLTVQGAEVLLMPSGPVAIDTTNVCLTPQSNTTKPCKNATVTTTQTTKLTVGGKPLLMMPVAGSSDGMVGGTTPQMLVTAVANQTKLTTL
jgi:hypothetical protein